MIGKVSKHDCTGCGACFCICPVNCIAMKADDEGFLYPHADMEKCTRCGKCLQVCPEINGWKKRDKLSEPGCYAAWSRNSEIRLKSSSGGIFSEMAQAVINEYGTVFGAVINSDFDVFHKDADSTEELKMFRGSKYVQSITGVSFEQAETALKEGMKVLFSGTPCQIAGLYNYLGKEYDGLYTCDLVCHGVPSPLYLLKYINYMSSQYNSQVIRLDFRNKSGGWKNSSILFVFENGLTSEISPRTYFNSRIIRPSCYKCKYANIARPGDITLGDFWKVGKIHPELDDDKGTSLILTNTLKGAGFIKNIKCEIHSSSIQTAIKGNPNLEKPTKMPIDRDLFFKYLKNKDFSIIIKRFLTNYRGIKKLINLLIRGSLTSIVRKFLSR